MSDRPLVYLDSSARPARAGREVGGRPDCGWASGGRSRAPSCVRRAGSGGRIRRAAWSAQRCQVGRRPASKRPRSTGATHVFWIADGRRNLPDQIEAVQAWLPASGGELARIVCVHPLRGWRPGITSCCRGYDACVCISADVVLFKPPEGVANKWMSDFQARYASQFLPCLFEFVKQRPGEKTRRWCSSPRRAACSHVFDDELNWEITEPRRKTRRAMRRSRAHPEVDPYLDRLPGGRARQGNPGRDEIPCLIIGGNGCWIVIDLGNRIIPS